MKVDYKISYIIDRGIFQEVKARFYQGDYEDMILPDGQIKKNVYRRKSLLHEQIYTFGIGVKEQEIHKFLQKELWHKGQPIYEQNPSI